MSRTAYCPFLVTDLLDKKGEAKISCEHGKLEFADKEMQREYMDQYCCHKDGWKHCTLAQSLMQYYDGMED